jgi:hypothetical protein
MQRGGRAALALAAIALPVVASAQDEPGKIDPATIAVPDISMPSDKSAAGDLIANGWKYSFFHKPGVSFDAAMRDVGFCYRFFRIENFIVLGSFAAWGERQKSPDRMTAGGIIGGAVEDMTARDILRSRWRRCMETRGYARYPMAQKIWEALLKDDPARSVPVFAKLASGPTPDLPVPPK